MGSLVHFDYTSVNDTSASVVASTSASGAGTASSTPSAAVTPILSSRSGSAFSSHSALKPIVGGTVGGIVVKAAMILAHLFSKAEIGGTIHAFQVPTHTPRLHSIPLISHKWSSHSHTRLCGI